MNIFGDPSSNMVCTLPTFLMLDIIVGIYFDGYQMLNVGYTSM